MNRAFVLPGILLAFATIVRASPPPPLPWETSSFSVRLGSEMVEFKMECPRGKLTRLSATRGQQVADVPMDRLAELSIPESCSGISSRASIETEGSRDVIGVELTVELSREYINEKLLISFDVKSFKFTQARRLLTYPPEDSQDTRIQL
jgi:hypothetical protein